MAKGSMNRRMVLFLVAGALLAGIAGGVVGLLIPAASESVVPALLAGILAGAFVVAVMRRRHGGGPRRS